jgi:hypothetical protein
VQLVSFSRSHGVRVVGCVALPGTLGTLGARVWIREVRLHSGRNVRQLAVTFAPVALETLPVQMINKQLVERNVVTVD